MQSYISINRERFDLIGVTLNDVWNIKCNILNIGNEEYMYSLRHAFQKFLSHLHQEPQRHKRFSSGDISTWSVPESPIPSKIPRGECRSFEDNEHDLSGVYCRSFEGSSEKQATSKSGEKKEPNAASIPSLRQVKRPTRELYQVQTSAKIALLSKHGNIDESGKSANENKIQYDPSMQGISVTLDNQKNTSVTKIKTTLGRETISKFTPRQVILNKTRERMSHSSGTTESDTSSETIDSANDKEGNNLKPTPKKRRERSFRDVLSLIQNTLLSLKVENGATPLSDSKTRKKLRVESPFIKTHDLKVENGATPLSDSKTRKKLRVESPFIKTHFSALLQTSKGCPPDIIKTFQDSIVSTLDAIERVLSSQEDNKNSKTNVTTEIDMNMMKLLLREVCSYLSPATLDVILFAKDD
ncbi:uncharacterized protein LOC103516376 [Diaphorina citri]|uniref:Uncharacterized protein LOC103516376 n=1 Tax=Diaphorina citri TaxID=121845 RepID=A0A3Q0JCY4_DIACI|nr:uncharacterized protein LOC103516376 [Diaphorina citri]